MRVVVPIMCVGRPPIHRLPRRGASRTRVRNGAPSGSRPSRQDAASVGADLLWAAQEKAQEKQRDSARLETTPERVTGGSSGGAAAHMTKAPRGTGVPVAKPAVCPSVESAFVRRSIRETMAKLDQFEQDATPDKPPPPPLQGSPASLGSNRPSPQGSPRTVRSPASLQAFPAYDPDGPGVVGSAEDETPQHEAPEPPGRRSAAARSAPGQEQGAWMCLTTLND